MHLGLPALATTLQSEYGLGLVALGALISAPAAGTMLALLAWGIAADRHGERMVLVAGLGGAAAALAAAALASPTALALAGWLVLAGLSGSVANAATGRAVVEWFPPEERGLAMGLRHSATPFGGGVAALVLPLLAEAAGIGAAFALLAALCAVSAVACGIVLRRPAPRPARPTDVRRPRPLRDGMVWGLSLSATGTTFAQLATLAFIVVYLHDVRGWPLWAAAAALAASQIAGAVARPLAGLWSDRAVSRLIPLRALALVAGGALLLLSAFGPLSPGIAAVLLVAAAVATMSGNGVSFAAVAEAAGADRAGTALGLQNTILFAAVIAGPPVFGALVVATGWPAAFAILALAPLAPLAAAAGYTLLARRPVRPR